MIEPATGWFEIVKTTNKSATFIQDLFHNTWLAQNNTRNLNLLFLTMGLLANPIVSSKKFVKIMKLKPNQLQVTANITQENAIIERVHKVASSQLYAQII
jgi:hypothetical protein